MRKVILLSQLISMSMLFAPRDGKERASVASREIPPIASRSLPSSPSKEELMPLTGLDRTMFKHWYRDCFKTKEIDGVTYFIELPERETKSPFVLMGMSSHTQIASLSVSVPCEIGNAQSIFRTSNGRPIRLKYTIRQKIGCGEVKDMFNSMIPKVKQMAQDMFDELYDAYRYGYEDHLPLDSIEVQDESGNIYLTCGIAQQSSVSKNYWISEPESIRIRIKATNQPPESRMSRKHLLAQLPTSCPEFYMSRRYLGMYHAIYSALNTELVESFAHIDPENFSRIEGYSLIPDILQKKRNKAIDYLEESGLEPSIYIPTYQHDMLMDSEKSYKPLALKTEEASDKASETTENRSESEAEAEVEPSLEMTAYEYDTLEDVDYGSLVFTHDPSDKSKCTFRTEVVNGLQYTLGLRSGNMKEVDLSKTFGLSDLINQMKPDYYLNVSFFCPAPGKFRKSSGNTEFSYVINRLVPEDTCNIISYLKVLSHKLKKRILELNEIQSVGFPLEKMHIREKTKTRFKERLYGPIPVPIYTWRNSDKRYDLDIHFSDEGKKLYPRLYFRDIKETIEEFLTEERMAKCSDVFNFLKSNIDELLQGVTDFTAREECSLRGLPSLLTGDGLTKESFWPKIQDLVRQTGGNMDVSIPDYLHDVLVKKLIQKYGPIMDGYDKDGAIPGYFEVPCDRDEADEWPQADEPPPDPEYEWDEYI